jgi:hypothetical protein
MRSYGIVGMGLIAAIAIVAPVLAEQNATLSAVSPSVKKAIKKEVSKQLAGKTGPAGAQGAQGAQGNTGNTGPRGPSDARESFQDPAGFLGTSFSTIDVIATGILGASNFPVFAISATVDLTDEANGTSAGIVDCQLVDFNIGSDEVVDSGQLEMGEGGTAISSGQITLHGLAFLGSGPGNSAAVQCRDTGPTANVDAKAKILAITVDRGAQN